MKPSAAPAPAVKSPTANDSSFWDRRYAAGQMAWDCGGVPHALREYLRRHPSRGRALIPGCGSGYEIQAFHATGWEVLGLDFSTVAVRRARALLGRLARRVRRGDFFVAPFEAANWQLVYERTFLCALPPSRWPDYARRMAELIAPGGVLCGYFFFGPEDDPPPYPIAPAELARLLGTAFVRIADEAVLDSLPLYAGKERWQVWRRHGGGTPPAPGKQRRTRTRSPCLPPH